MKSPLSYAAAALCTVLALAPPARASAPETKPKSESALERLLVVPEPASLLLLGVGVSALAIRMRARRHP